MSKKGIYVEMAHHPQAILDAMAGMEGAVARANILQQLLKYIPKSLQYIGGAGFVVVFILAWTKTLESAGCLAFPFFAIGAVGAVLAIVSARWRAPHLRDHFDAARQILHTLRDDTGRRGRVVGWLDLSGPTKKEKEVRTARSGGGKQKIYYRDPWFKVKFKLVDGNLLRLTLEDKVKTKAGSIVRHQSQFSAKLVVNPDLYCLCEAPARPVYVGGAAVSREDGAFVVKAARPAENLSEGVLQTLKAVYSLLEPTGLELPLTDTVDATAV